ncbi:Clavaminate synthase-like protein [Panaeolus papilionaceus]|nr:Clavaminate synthase-like protein [Panaeolus papilionaceus]
MLDKLPVIDIAPLLNPNSDKNSKAAVSATLHSACVDYGFFYLNLDAYIDRTETEELARLGKEFFSLPQDEKDKLSIKNQDYARGYQRLHENVTNGKADNHEGLDFYKPVANPDKGRPLWGENQWPSVPGFKEKYEIWVQKMKGLGLIMMEAMAVGLGLTREEWATLRGQVDDSFWVMRVIGYPPLPKDHDGISCGAHKDYGCLTFLYADPTPSALQVFLKQPRKKAVVVDNLPSEQGNEEGIWINVDPIPGCVVCNIGEMWEIWTNGLYRSTLHRVIHTGANYRVSIPFFFEPNFDAHIQPVESVVNKLKDEGTLEKYGGVKPVVYGDFLLKKVGSNFDTTGKDRY